MEELHVWPQSASPIFFRIYGLKDPRDGLIKYVGRTRKMGERYRGHLSLPRKRKMTAKEEWVKGLLSAGLRPDLVILECVPQGWESSAEGRWIRNIKAKGHVFNVLQTGPERAPRRRRHTISPRQKARLAAEYNRACDNFPGMY